MLAPSLSRTRAGSNPAAHLFPSVRNPICAQQPPLRACCSAWCRCPPSAFYHCGASVRVAPIAQRAGNHRMTCSLKKNLYGDSNDYLIPSSIY